MNAPAFPQNMELLNGNHAVAWAVRLAGPDVAPLYPITPQTPILEKLIEFKSAGDFDAELLTPESEHSAMAAAIAASATGARVFTATSSQGLMLMHELLHYASGARTPIVLFNVNRTPASPWGFWPDQIDSLSQRDTGWVQLYSEEPQESLDMTIQAFRIAETANLPVMVNHDAFYVSHSVEPVILPSAKTVSRFLPRQTRDITLGDGSGRSMNAPVDQQSWNQSRRSLHTAMMEVEALVTQAGQDWEAETGRATGPIECYRIDGADVVFVTMGSMCGTAREAVDRLRAEGIKAGLLKVRLFRPLPEELLRSALSQIPHAVVLDRNCAPGAGGVLHQELKSALFETAQSPQLHGYMAGVGGVSVSVERLEALAKSVPNLAPQAQSQWLE